MDDLATLKHTLARCGKLARRRRWRQAMQHRVARLAGLYRSLAFQLGDRFVRRERVEDAVVFLARDDGGTVTEAARIVGVSGQRTTEELDRPIDVRVLAPELLSRAAPGRNPARCP